MNKGLERTYDTYELEDEKQAWFRHGKRRSQGSRERQASRRLWGSRGNLGFTRILPRRLSMEVVELQGGRDIHTSAISRGVGEYRISRFYVGNNPVQSCSR